MYPRLAGVLAARKGRKVGMNRREFVGAAGIGVAVVSGWRFRLRDDAPSINARLARDEVIRCESFIIRSPIQMRGRGQMHCCTIQARGNPEYAVIVYPEAYEKRGWINTPVFTANIITIQ